MNVDAVNSVTATAASTSSNQPVKRLGTESEPLRGPVLAKSAKTGEAFWTDGAVGSFRSSKMISELRLVDSSGGVQEALRTMGRDGRGLEVYGGANRNYFTVGVPSSEYLTSQGSVTFQVTYADGTSEKVSFHMAPADESKIARTASRLPNASILGIDETSETLASILGETTTGAPQATLDRSMVQAVVEKLPETVSSQAVVALQKEAARQEGGENSAVDGLSGKVRELQLQAYHVHFMSPNAAEALSRMA